MTAEQALVEALSPLPILSGRVFPLEALKNAAAPFVFYLRQTAEEREDLDGPTGLRSAVFEIHCVARTYQELTVLAEAAHRALLDLRGGCREGLCIQRAAVRQASPDLREREVCLCRRALLFEIHYQQEEST